MADVTIQGEADELAVAMVQALAQQDGDRALAIGMRLETQMDDRPGLRARHAAWMAQAHLMQGEHDCARHAIRRALALAAEIGDADALPALRKLQSEVMQAKAAAAVARDMPLPDTPVGRAVSTIDAGDLTDGIALARVARDAARTDGNAREEVLALLAMARDPREAEGAIRAASTVADESQDKNLVTAVARAAQAAGVSLPTHVF